MILDFDLEGQSTFGGGYTAKKVFQVEWEAYFPD